VVDHHQFALQAVEHGVSRRRLCRRTGRSLRAALPHRRHRWRLLAPEGFDRPRRAAHHRAAERGRARGGDAVQEALTADGGSDFRGAPGHDPAARRGQFPATSTVTFLRTTRVKNLRISRGVYIPIEQIPVIRPKSKSKHKRKGNSRSSISTTSADTTDDDDRLACELDDGEEQGDVTTCEDDPPSPGIPGDWGPDNHTVGPGGGWPSGPSTPAPPQPSWGPPLPRHSQQPWPSRRRPNQPPPKPTPELPKQRSPNGDPFGYSNRDVWTGLGPEDRPVAGLYPGSDNPTACPPASREVFKCRGKVYLGCKNLCPDYGLDVSKRWADAWNDVGKNWGMLNDDAAFRTYIRHLLWNDGKNPGCKDNCQLFGLSICTSEAILVTAGCDVITGGACHAALVASWYAGLGAATVIPECGVLLGSRCIRNECDP
jgi:hypothetical protein